jgi:hypothetical protein
MSIFSHMCDVTQVAWVTRAGSSEMDKPIAIRPTSETVRGCAARACVCVCVWGGGGGGGPPAGGGAGAARSGVRARRGPPPHLRSLSARPRAGRRRRPRAARRRR